MSVFMIITGIRTDCNQPITTSFWL